MNNPNTNELDAAVSAAEGGRWCDRCNIGEGEYEVGSLLWCDRCVESVFESAGFDRNEFNAFGPYGDA